MNTTKSPEIKFSYRVTSMRANSSLQPQTFTHSLEAAIEAAYGHANELPGCQTAIEKREGSEWKFCLAID